MRGGGRHGAQRLGGGEQPAGGSSDAERAGPGCGRRTGRRLAVQLTRRQGIGEQLFGAIGSLFVIGIGLGLPLVDCLQQDPALPLCADDDTVAVRVDAEGRWQADVPDGPGDYDVTVVDLVDDRVQVQAVVAGFEDAVAPDLRLWAPAVGAQGDPGAVRFGVDPMPALPGLSEAPPTHELALVPDRERAVVAAPVVSGTRAEVDARLLEDVPGRAVFAATGEVAGSTVTWFSPPVAYPAPAGAPLSRGAPCGVVVGVGGAPVDQGACWATDGALGGLGAGSETDPFARPLQCREDPDAPSSAGFALCSRPAVNALTLDLARPQPVGEVVVRGCPGRCVVETSADGATWTVPGAATGESDAFADDGGAGHVDVVEVLGDVQARWVRVRADGMARRAESSDLIVFDASALPAEEAPALSPDLPTSDLAALAEVSVWPPRPPAAPVEGLALPGQPAPGPSSVPGAVAGLPAGPVAGAVVLLVAAAAAVATAPRSTAAPAGRRLAGSGLLRPALALPRRAPASGRTAPTGPPPRASAAPSDSGVQVLCVLAYAALAAAALVLAYADRDGQGLDGLGVALLLTGVVVVAVAAASCLSVAVVVLLLLRVRRHGLRALRTLTVALAAPLVLGVLYVAVQGVVPDAREPVPVLEVPPLP